MLSTNGGFTGPKRAILYVRVSTDEQARSGYSRVQQLEAPREYALGEGYEVLEEVVDAGESGASLERPGMDRVQNLVAASEDMAVMLRTAISCRGIKLTFENLIRYRVHRFA